MDSVLKETEIKNKKFLKPKSISSKRSIEDILSTKIILASDNSHNQLYPLKHSLGSLDLNVHSITNRRFQLGTQIPNAFTKKIKLLSIVNKKHKNNQFKYNQRNISTCKNNEKNSHTLDNNKKLFAISLKKKVNAINKDPSHKNQEEDLPYKNKVNVNNINKKILNLSPLTMKSINMSNKYIKTNDMTTIKTLTQESKSMSLRFKNNNNNEFNLKKSICKSVGKGNNRIQTIALNKQLVDFKLNEYIKKQLTDVIQLPKEEFNITHFINKEQSYVSRVFGKVYNNLSSKYSYWIEQNIFDLNNFYIFSVLESYGSEGHKLCALTKLNLFNYFTNINLYVDNKHLKPDETVIYDILTKNNYEVIHCGFNKVNKDILNTKFDPEKSGIVTAITFVIGNKLVNVNLGNIKSTLMIQTEIKELEKVNLVELSSIHSLDNRTEIQRIKQSFPNALVAKYTGEDEDEDKDVDDAIYEYNRILSPKMKHSRLTRALGLNDYVHYGLSHIPEINVMKLDENTKCLIIASQNFYDILGTTFLMKFLSLVMGQNEHISIASNQLMEAYEKRLNLNNSINQAGTDCVYLIVYF